MAKQQMIRQVGSKTTIFLNYPERLDPEAAVSITHVHASRFHAENVVRTVDIPVDSLHALIHALLSIMQSFDKEQSAVASSSNGNCDSVTG